MQKISKSLDWGRIQYIITRNSGGLIMWGKNGRAKAIKYRVTGNGVLYIASKDIIKTTAAKRQIAALGDIKVSRA